MPELPDVHIFQKYLEGTSLHQPIERVEVNRREILENISPRSLQKRLTGKTLESTRRRGKYLFAGVDDAGWLVLHFGMTGYLKYSRDEESPDHTRVLLRFENGAALAYVCMRMLGRVTWTNDVDAFCREKELGIDAFSDELDFRKFQELLASKRGSIKSALMDQKTIAGLGNVYVDEILFQAKVHPKTAVMKLEDTTLREIHKQIRRVLKAAIRAKAEPKRLPKTFLLPRRGEEGAKCPRCEGLLKTIKVSGRTTTFCPSCQSE